MANYPLILSQWWKRDLGEDCLRLHPDIHPDKGDITEPVAFAGSILLRNSFIMIVRGRCSVIDMSYDNDLSIFYYLIINICILELG